MFVVIKLNKGSDHAFICCCKLPMSFVFVEEKQPSQNMAEEQTEHIEPTNASNTSAGVIVLFLFSIRSAFLFLSNVTAIVVHPLMKTNHAAVSNRHVGSGTYV